MADGVKGKQRDLIAELSAFLREHGEQILTGRKKLSLTSRALCLLNHGFSQISDSGDFSTSFDVLPTNRTQIPMYTDLQFLYDFVQKAVAIKVIHGNTTIQGSVNIASFRMLKSLDINKVPLHLVTGIQKFRNQLQTLICTRCLQSLQELYEGCGRDQSNPMSWPALTASSVAHNNLHELDASLRLLPALATFDVSHNVIITTERHLEYLTNLCWLSLAFNSLQTMPTFSLSAKASIKTLVLRHNCLDNINGVDDLVNLTEFDVGYNCLDSHNNLSPLRDIHKLNKLLLVGNPIETIKDHRKRSMAHISPVAAKKLVFDGKPISDKELKICKVTQPGWRQPSHSTPSRNNTPINAPSNIEFSIDSMHDEGDGAPLVPSQSRKKKGKGKKPRKGRDVLISDQDDTGAADTTSEIESVTCPSQGTSYSSKSDHIQIREKMEEARRQLGTDWLQVTVDRSRRATEHEGDIGPDGREGSTDEPISSHETEPTQAYPVLSPVKNTLPNGHKSSPESDNKNASQGSSKRVSPVSLTENNDSVKPLNGESVTKQMKSHTKLQRSKALPGMTSHMHDPEMVRPLLKKTDSDFVDAMWKRMEPVEHNEDLGDESDPFIVYLENEPEQQYIISVTDRYILEKDLNGYVFEKLDLSCLLNAQTVNQMSDGSNDSNPATIKMMFSHVKRNKKERILVMEDEHSLKELLNILEPTLEGNKAEAKLKDQLQCLKCQTQFSKRNANRMVKESSIASNLSNLQNIATLEEVFACPNCTSTMLIELDLQGSRSQGAGSASATPVFGTPLATSSAFTSPCKNGDNNNVYSRGEDSTTLEHSASFKSVNSSSHTTPERNPDLSNYTSLGSTKDSTDYQNSDSTNTTTSKNQTPKAGMSTGQLRECEENFTRNHSTSSFHSLTSSRQRASCSSADSDILVLSKNTTVEQESVCITTQRSEDSDITLVQSSQTVGRSSIESDISVIGQDSNVKIDNDAFKPQLDSLPESSPCGSLTKSTLNSMVSSMYEKSLSATNSESTIVVKPGSSVDILQPRAASDQNFPIDGSPGFLRLSPEGAAAVPPSETSSFRSAGSSTFKSLESAKQLRRAKRAEAEDRDRIEFDYSDFSQIDHRLRLHLDMEVFNNDEEFCLILRCSMSRFTKPEETQVILVASNSRLFIFSVNGKEIGDNISKWLRLVHKESLVELQYVDIGLGYQSFRMEFGKEDNCFKFLVRDESACKQFVGQLARLVQSTAFISGSKLQGITKSSPETIQAVTEQILGVTDKTDDTDTEILKYVMGYMPVTSSTTSGKGKKMQRSVGVLVTCTHICLCEENHQWPRPRCLSSGTSMKGQHFTLNDRQTINNIASIELYEDRPKDLKIDFFDEEESAESSWHVTMETEAELLALLTSVREPWESAFGIELQVNTVQVDS